ncbi:MAG: substrate-binding domain-containing protein [Gammaproteobacteria bacterium]|nr:substrate-binding domain-containing protein [Gammaproteobacteria bacterium]
MKKYVFLFIIFLANFALPVFAEPIAIIVNKNNPQNEISLKELDNIYRAKATTWNNGSQIVPINQELTATKGIREAFSRIIHNASLDDIQAFWLGQRYKGIKPPLTQQSSLAVKRMVANVEEAVGYIYANEVDDSVKVLKVDGLSPNDPGYKIND